MPVLWSVIRATWGSTSCGCKCVFTLRQNVQTLNVYRGCQTEMRPCLCAGTAEQGRAGGGGHVYPNIFKIVES